MNEKQVLSADDVRRATTRMAHEIIERNQGLDGVTVVGIQTGGVWLAEALGAEIARIESEIPVGSVDASLYRDDIGLRPVTPASVSDIGFDVDGATIVLVDDVLFTGRTVRAALDALGDYGRPRAVQLAVMIDPDALEVAFRVSTLQYARLLDDSGRLRRVPVTARLELYGGNLVATGTLSREGAAVGEGQTGRVLYATLDQAAGFKPGDFVTVDVTEPALERVVRLPATALDPSGAVLVVGDDDRLESVPVTLVRRQGDDVLLRGEALEGRDVVMQRTPLLGAGIKVKPLRLVEDAPAVVAPQMLELSQERRAKLVAFVEANQRMPKEAKARVLARLAEPTVPAQMVARIESRMGG